MKREKFVPTPAYFAFLRKLRLARQEKGVSQRELARRLEGWHWSKIIRSENAERELTIIEVRDICQALGISVVDFTHELDGVLNAMEAEAATSANADAPASDDNAPSTTPPSSLL